MAAPKTWVSGETITATDLNTVSTVAGNSGLVLVTPSSVTNGTISNGIVTVGSAVSSVTVTAFSTTYDNYRVIISGITPSATDSFRLQLGSATTGHYGSMYYDSWDGGATSTLRVGNGSSIYIGLDEGSAKTSSVGFDIISPNLAQATQMFGNWSGRGFFGWFGGLQSSSTQFTAFTLKPDSAGTFTGGTIAVYGYRKS